MLPVDSDPVLAEARLLAHEMRLEGIAAQAASTSEAAARHRHEHDRLRAELDALLEVPQHRNRVDRALDERAGILRIAVHARAAERAHEQRLDEANEIVSQAIAAHRPLTAAEHARIAELRAPDEAAPWQRSITSSEKRDGVFDVLAKLRLREARQQLRDGLLLTQQMREIIAEALPAVLRGDPVLFVGETGGAKTALAEHLASRSVNAEPELISGYGDITSAQLIGSYELRAEHGATVSMFVPGPLLRAMQEGRPVILDELNAMPAEFLKRLNRILQLRPGDTLGVQEHSGRPVRIAPGFAILATANEHTPHRYRGIDRLSAELVNRFAANGYRVHYPDTGKMFDEFPTENALLAAAAAVDIRAELPPAVSSDELVRVARAAFISQQVFAGANGTGFATFISTEREVDGRPGLDEAVLAPRTLVAIVQKVAGSAGQVTLERALTRFVESVMHREDRRVLALILEGQGFTLGH